MRLYSYRGVSYTIAPPGLSSTGHDPINEPSSVEQPLEKSSKQTSPQKLALPQPQAQTPTSVIPMVYRGVLYLLERFHTPCPSPDEEFLETCSDESIEAAESAKLTDE